MAQDQPEIISNGYALSVVDDKASLLAKAEAMKEVSDSWIFCKPVKVLYDKIMKERTSTEGKEE